MIVLRKSGLSTVLRSAYTAATFCQRSDLNFVPTGAIASSGTPCVIRSHSTMSPPPRGLRGRHRDPAAGDARGMQRGQMKRHRVLRVINPGSGIRTRADRAMDQGLASFQLDD